jgi:polyisoprenoid-binding protein YceI
LRGLYLAVSSILALAAPPTFAASWQVDTGKSHLSFTGMQTGTPFHGSFGKWGAEIDFDPAHPEAGHVSVAIDLASATTGDTQRDSALPQADWFDVKKFPQATFEATGFTAKGGDAYETSGKLTIRGVGKDVTLPFTLTVTDDKATSKGHLSLIRTAFGIGQGAWSTGQWVALDVGIDVELTATKIGG